MYGGVEEENVYQKIKRYTRAVSLKNHLRKARLGLVGYGDVKKELVDFSGLTGLRCISI